MTDIFLANSPSCGVSYRRIIDVTEPGPSPALSGKDHYYDSVMPRASNLKKRKLSKSFENGDQGLFQREADFDSDPEEDIHLFRRIHIRSTKAKGLPRWIRARINSCLFVSDDRLTVYIHPHVFRPDGRDTFAVCAARPFDDAFSYFEVTFIPSRGPPCRDPEW